MSPLHIQLQQARSERQISPAEMARLLGISLQQYIDVESGMIQENDELHQKIVRGLLECQIRDQDNTTNTLVQLALELNELGLKIELLNRKINGDTLL